MGMSFEERKSFGWFGQPPKEVINGSREITARWKRLAKRADEVRKMRSKEKRLEAAKLLERERDAIITQAIEESTS